VLYDLEFLVDEQGRRISAFGCVRHICRDCAGMRKMTSPIDIADAAL
jgi:hypothetical protein